VGEKQFLVRSGGGGPGVALESISCPDGTKRKNTFLWRLLGNNERIIVGVCLKKEIITLWGDSPEGSNQKGVFRAETRRASVYSVWGMGKTGNRHGQGIGKKGNKINHKKRRRRKRNGEGPGTENEGGSTLP